MKKVDIDNSIAHLVQYIADLTFAYEVEYQVVDDKHCAVIKNAGQSLIRYEPSNVRL